jgi:hypothetical protein
LIFVALRRSRLIQKYRLDYWVGAGDLMFVLWLSAFIYVCLGGFLGFLFCVVVGFFGVVCFGLWFWLCFVFGWFFGVCLLWLWVYVGFVSGGVIVGWV